MLWIWKDHAWDEQECSNIWHMIAQSIEDVDHQNVLLFLHVGDNINKVQECLQLPSETIDILILWYIFAIYSKQKGQELSEQGNVYASVKPVVSVIVILQHLANSTKKMNLASENINIDPIYIESDSWDVCTKFQRSPQPLIY